MALRLLQINLPEEKESQLDKTLQEVENPIFHRWSNERLEGNLKVELLVKDQNLDVLLDRLEKRFNEIESFSIVLLAVEAVVPRIEEKKQEEAADNIESASISREELYQDISQAAERSSTFYVLVVLSTIVAAIGMLNNNGAVIIGAMVIAPLLGPNMALSLSTTLADKDLGLDAIKSNFLGFLITIVLSLIVGFLLHVDPSIKQIAMRTQVNLGDVLLALSAGTAGALAFTTGIGTSLIGVMVAVALLPPGVAVGLLIGSGHGMLAVQALLLLLTYLIGINLSGVLTFLLQGVQPLNWWKEQEAKKASRIAIGLWSFLMILLVALILLSQYI